ncbi:hypothetical protein AXG93_3112s1070 [Marchantia polymorpha subsp. ruderalis]|uniref:Disease resistance R13L4/SHOC-2-like LRR domain-containing protein n=1 Tax=Marchantia polymorpha subsp. ruderalis TaxID=1480154 RepID=A0A176W7B2_MARPO|nr:hypothetical protein AXG93_3112s1070 [Marchantia polymorpha subsp. ruderalis]
MTLNLKSIGQMKKLRYLDSEKELMLDEVGGELSKTVVLLRLCGKMSSICDLVDGGRECLAVLDLKAPLTCLPTTFSELQNLEFMNFEACLFEGLPETFGKLPRLRRLTFRSCKRLRSLPESFVRLSELRSLELHHCYNFKALPDSFGQLPCLETLIMVSLFNLQRLPEGFGNLSQLKRLVISDAHNITELPKSFGRLAELRNLHLDDMSDLQALPDTFGQLSQLSHLSIAGCNMKQELPHSFGQLPNLTSLDLSRCRSLKVYRSSMAAIQRLRSLTHLQVEAGWPGTFSFHSKVSHRENLSESELRELASFFRLNQEDHLKDDKVLELLPASASIVKSHEIENEASNAIQNLELLMVDNVVGETAGVFEISRVDVNTLETMSIDLEQFS